MVQVQSNKWIRGLDLNSNPYTYVVGKDPYGGARNACVIADDCVLTRQRMIGNRKGFDYFTASTSALIDWMYEYQNYIIQHQSDNKLYYGDNSTGTRTQYTGTFTPPSTYRMDAAVARGNLYFTSTSGVMKLDKFSNTPIRAGITKALDTRVTTTGTGNGFMSGFSTCAYRITWRRTDANNQLVRGDVSTSITVTNSNQQTPSSLTSTAGTATCTTPAAHGWTTGDFIVVAGATQSAYNGTVQITVTGGTTFTYTVAGGPTSPATGTITVQKYLNTSVAFVVPADVISGDYYEIWRTATVSATFTSPGDTMYLVTAVQNAGSAGSTVTFTDTTPDTTLLANQALYTNATQSGALQGNERPPYCSAIASYKDYGIYANTAIDYQYNLTMLATINFVAGTSTITINDGTGSRTYTGNSAENTGTNVWQIYTGGLSNALNIQQSAQSLCHVINSDASGRWYAEYTSGPTSNPGAIRIWARLPTSGSFWFTVNNSTTGNQFSPTLPTSGQTVIASNDARPNRLFYSAFQQPDGVPILNTIDVGRLDQPILRVIAVRDACFVIKADGVWYLSGLSAPFSLVELDSTCHCVAASSVALMNNQILMLSNQGVVQVSTSGITVISVDIEPAIMQTALPMSNLSTVAFGVAHEAARQYYLWLPSSTNDTYATQAYVYQNFIQEWTHWTKPASSGIALNSNYTLYISSGKEKALLKQRNTGDNTDYADESVTVTVVSQTGTTVTVTWSNSTFTPSIGMALVQSTSLAKVLSVTNTTGNTWKFVIDRTVTYSAGAATAQIPIFSHLRLSPNVLQEAGMVKSIYSVSFLPQSSGVTQVNIEVATNESPSLYTFPIVRAIGYGWGVLGWGSTPWGDSLSAVQVVPFLIDMPVPDMTGESVTAGWLHSVAQEQWIMAQCAVLYDQLAEIENVA